MRSVETHVPRRELRERMAVMRVWLDEHRFEPSIFSCHDEEEHILVHIEFKVASEAMAFAERFSGRLSTAGGGETAGREKSAILNSILPGRPIG